MSSQDSIRIGAIDMRLHYLGYNGSAPTGIAPVQAWPTTAAQWAIWNPEPYKSYVIHALGAILFSGTNAVGGTLLFTIFSAPASVGVNATGLATLGGSNTQTSKAIIKSGVTITGPAVPVWVPIADALLSGIVTLPSSIIVNRGIDGRIIVPPGQGLGLAVLAPAGTTQLFLPIAEWAELESDLE